LGLGPPFGYFLDGVESVSDGFFAAELVDDGHEGGEIGEEIRPIPLTKNSQSFFPNLIKATLVKNTYFFANI
jgi:hypothetical protein